MTAFVTRQGSLPTGSADIGILPQSAIANPSVWARFLHLLVKVIDAFLLRCMCVLDLLLAAAVLLYGYFLATANVLFIQCRLSPHQIRRNSSVDLRRYSRSQFSRDI